MPLAHAARLFETGGDRQDLGIVRTEQAKAARHFGERENAKRLALEACELLESAPLMQGGALWVYAWAHTEANPGEAAKIYRHAVGALEAAHELQDASAAGLEWADVLDAANRPDDAATARGRAATIRELLPEQMGRKRKSRAGARAARR